jgi:hypothetical protein
MQETKITIEATESVSARLDTKKLPYRFGEYDVIVVLNSINEFVGIEQIALNRSFYDYKSVSGDVDIRKYLDE